MKADLFDGLVDLNEKPACQKGSGSTVKRSADAVEGDESVADCVLCVCNSPVYDFGLVCCRVRFILSVPVLDIRREWLDRWKRMDSEMCAEVEREVEARWKLNRKAMRNADNQD